MFNRIKNLWAQSKTKEPLYLDISKLNAQQLADLQKALAEPGVVVRMPEEALGDGKAEFLGEGTHADYEDFKKEESGMKPWYERLKNL